MENPEHTHTHRMCKMWWNLMIRRSGIHRFQPYNWSGQQADYMRGSEHWTCPVCQNNYLTKSMYSNTANTSIQASIFEKPRHVYGTRTVAHVLQLQLATIWTWSMLGASQSAKTFCWTMRILIMVLNVRRAFQSLFADIWFWRWWWLVASICHYSW